MASAAQSPEPGAKPAPAGRATKRGRTSITTIYGGFVQYELVRTLQAQEVAAYGHRVIDRLMPIRDRW